MSHSVHKFVWYSCVNIWIIDDSFCVRLYAQLNLSVDIPTIPILNHIKWHTLWPQNTRNQTHYYDIYWEFDVGHSVMQIVHNWIQNAISVVACSLIMPIILILIVTKYAVRRVQIHIQYLGPHFTFNNWTRFAISVVTFGIGVSDILICLCVTFVWFHFAFCI